MVAAVKAPEVSTEDLAYVKAVHGMMVEDTGRQKFTVEDIINGGPTGTDMYDIACQWARTQTEADFEWLRKIAQKEAKGKPGTCGLRDKEAAGVLNCLIASLRRPAPQAPRQAPVAAPQQDDQELAAHEAYLAWVDAQELAASKAYEEYRAGQVPQGYYTVIDGDDYRTFKIGPWKEDTYRPGGRIRWIGLLTGQDNTGDYETCARQISSGEVTMHGTFRNSSTVATWLAGLMGESVEGHAAARQAYAEASKRCARCGRELTVPASLYAGVGPECLKKIMGE